MAKERPRIGDIVEIRNCIARGVSTTRDTIYGILLQKPYTSSYSYSWDNYYIFYLPYKDKSIKPIFNPESELASYMNNAAIDALENHNVLYVYREAIHDSIFLNNRESNDYDIKVGDTVWIRRWLPSQHWQVLTMRDEMCVLINPLSRYPSYGNWICMRNRRYLVKLSGRHVIRPQIEPSITEQKDLLKGILKNG